jgi:hypothetical protein
LTTISSIIKSDNSSDNDNRNNNSNIFIHQSIKTAALTAADRFRARKTRQTIIVRVRDDMRHDVLSGSEAEHNQQCRDAWDRKYGV